MTTKIKRSKRMGMAPTPEALQRQKTIREGNGEPPRPMVEGEIPVDSPLFKSEISQLIHGISWLYQKRVLDHVEVLCNNDRSWEIVRKIVMGIQTEQTETLRKVIGGKVRELQVRLKETVDE
jgi:hypothetical protein